MSKFKKYPTKNNYIKASDTKRKRTLQLFDRSCILLLVIILISLAISQGQPYEIKEAVNHGPALWFLLLMAYPILAVLGLINIMLQSGSSPVVEYFTIKNPALGLAILDMIYLGIIYILIRRRGLHWFGVSGVRAASHFVLIMAVWGIFQLMMTSVMVLWNAGGLTPFHAEDPEPETPTQIEQMDLSSEKAPR